MLILGNLEEQINSAAEISAHGTNIRFVPILRFIQLDFDWAKSW